MTETSTEEKPIIERPWASPRQEPVNGIVQPRVIAPFGKPVRHTNKLDYILNVVLKEAQKHKHSWPFIKPVDAQSLGIPLYHERITRPMDMKTIENRIKNMYYTCGQEAIDDIETIFNNCYSFNGPEDDVTIMAQNVHAVVKKSLESAPQDEIDCELSAGKKKKTKGGELSRLAAGSEDRKRKEGSVRMSEPPSENGSETSEKHVIERKMGSKTMKTASKRKADSDDDEKIEPIRPHKREASTKKTQPVPLPSKMKFCQKLLTELYAKKYYEVAWPFYEPVNADALGLHDYHKIIKHPMDMGTIKRKMETGEYKEPSEFEHDFRLMLNNCLLYNPVGDPIHVMGGRFLEIFDKKWKEQPSEKSSLSSTSTSSSVGAGVGSHSATHSSNLAPSSGTSKAPKVSHVAPMPMVKQEHIGGSSIGAISTPAITTMAGIAATGTGAATTHTSSSQPIEGGRARSEDMMQFENALTMIAEKEETMKKDLKHLEKLKNDVLQAKRGRFGHDDLRIIDQLLLQVRMFCQSNNGGVSSSSSSLFAGGGGYGGASQVKTNGREKKSMNLGYEFDSDTEESNKEMSYEDKRALSLLINRLPAEHLSTIVTIIERREKLPRTTDDSEIEIDFEALGTKCLREMDAFARHILKIPPKSATTSAPSAPAPPTVSTPLTTSSAAPATLAQQKMSTSLAPPPPLPSSQPQPPTLSASSSSLVNTLTSSSSAQGAGAATAAANSKILKETIEKQQTTGKEATLADKKKKNFSISESSDSDLNRKRKNKDTSDTSSSSSDEDSEDDFRARPKSKTPRDWGGGRIGGMGGQPPMMRVPPPLPRSAASSSSSSSGAAAAAAAAAASVLTSSSSGGSTTAAASVVQQANQVLKNSSTGRLGKMTSSSTMGAGSVGVGVGAGGGGGGGTGGGSVAPANPSVSILDTLLPPLGATPDRGINEKYEDEEARIERLRREARLAREQEEDENSNGPSQMEIMNNFEHHNMY